MSAFYNLTITKNISYDLSLTWKGSDRAAIDLTGWTARMQIKSEIGGEVYFTLTTENGGITLGGTDGTVEVTIAYTDTATIDWDKAVYDLHMISPGSVRSVLLSGTVSVKDTVTV